MSAPQHAESVSSAEALIEEARRRHRRRQRVVAAAVLLLATLGLVLGLGFGAPQGGKPTSLASGGGASSGVGGHNAASTHVITASTAIPVENWSLSLEHGLVAVSRGTGQGCTTLLFNPATLRRAGSGSTCPDPVSGGMDLPLVLGYAAGAEQIRVRPTSGSTVGPVVLTTDPWSWAHSSAIAGDGMVWIYGLRGFKRPSMLVEVSQRTGEVVHRFAVDAGADPYLAVDADGFWITQGIWGGGVCSTTCSLWRVAPGSGRLTIVRSLGAATQWLTTDGHSIYADVLTGKAGNLTRSLWRLDGPSASVAYERRARLLPSPDFGGRSGYIVLGDARQGFLTLSQLGGGSTPSAIGECDADALIRVVRIDPANGAESYVATLPKKLVRPLDCHLSQLQGAITEGSLYLLADNAGPGAQFGRVVRVHL